MATENEVKALKDILSQLVSLDRARLIERPQWGQANFKSLKPELDAFFGFVDALESLPVRLIPSEDIRPLTLQIGACNAGLQRIDKFDPNQSAANTELSALKNVLNSNHSSILNICAKWLPFLAYTKGDLSQKLSKVDGLIEKSETAYSKIEQKGTELEQKAQDILQAMQTASSSAGVGHFSMDFQTAADDKKSAILFWGWSVLILSILTLAAACAGFYHALIFDYIADKQPLVWLIISSKIIVLLVLISATLWCGKMYKAEKHQQAINYHKAHALRTFQAFSEAAPDPDTKSAILLETTKAIFSGYNPGYLENADAVPADSLKILEFFRGAGRNSSMS